MNPDKVDEKKEQQDLFNLAIIDCNYHIINNVPVDFALASYMQTNIIDFIALFVKSETFLERLFSNKDSKVTISKISKPVLVLHP